MKRTTRTTIVASVVILVVLLLGWTFVNPHADVPVISRIVCSIKGGTWTDGSVPLGIQVGCYKVESPSTDTSPSVAESVSPDLSPSESVTYECNFCYPVGDPPGWPEYHDLGLGDPPGGFPAVVIGSPDNPCVGQRDVSGNLYCSD
jgi:hypothetical protein